jgi:peptidoglycan/xylan/chitin deacetylase (PgdA/CDA1 family)
MLRVARVLVVSAVGFTQAALPPAGRTIAITIDDLPYVHLGPSSSYEIDAARATTEILRVLRAHQAPAVGFVNEGKLWAAGHRDERVALLKQWVDAGMTLGNHTYSHPDFNRVTIEQFEKEIVDGETVTRRIMQSRHPYQLYFRHPMTHTGDSREKKEALERFLAGRGYKIAPHTIENSDFLFNVPYVDGRVHDDTVFMARIRTLYLNHTFAAAAFAERISGEIFGREVPQTLLIHANDINADCLDEILTKFEARNYRFISLDAAMADAAYQTRDTYVGTYGPTWLFRWAKSLNPNVSFKDDPEMPPLPSRPRQSAGTHPSFNGFKTQYAGPGR